MSCLVLVEGMDYSGKSTTIHNVADLLNDHGFETIVNVGGLYKSWWDKFCTDLYELDTINDRLLALLFSISPVIDSIFYKKPKNMIVLQETYASRAIAYNWAHDYKLLYWWMSSLSKFYIKFDLTFYLYTNLDIRTQRFLSRPNSNKNDNILIDNQDIFIATENKLRELISNSDCSHFIDTGKKSPLEVTELVTRHIISFLRKRDANII